MIFEVADVPDGRGRTPTAWPSRSLVATSSGSTRRGSAGRSRRSRSRTFVGSPRPFSTRADTPAQSPGPARVVPDNPSRCGTVRRQTLCRVLPGRSDQSCRSALTGSTLAARRAG